MKNKTALSAALIYVITNPALTFLSSALRFASRAGNVSFFMFFRTGILWLFTAVALIIVLLLLYKKQSVLLSDAFNDSTARRAVGLIFILGVLISLPSIVSGAISDIQGMITESNSHNHNYIYMTNLRREIFDVSIPIFIYICQIILGLYLSIHKRKSHGDKCADNTSSVTVSSIVLFYISATLIASLLTSIISSISFHPPYFQFSKILNNYVGLLLTVSTIVFLYYIVKKHSNGFNMLKDDTVRFSSALLILTGGLLDFSLIAPSAIINYIFLLHPNGDSGSMTYHVEGNSSYFLIVLIAPILQILFGIWLLKYRSTAGDLGKSKPDNEIL